MKSVVKLKKVKGIAKSKKYKSKVKIKKKKFIVKIPKEVIIKLKVLDKVEGNYFSEIQVKTLRGQYFN